MITHCKVIKVVWPVAQLLVGPTFHADVRCFILSLVGEKTKTIKTQKGQII